MALLAPSQGDYLMLQYVTHKLGNADLKLHLFNNNVTPSKSDTLTTYTESTASGYAAITLTGSSWTVSTTSGVTTASYPQQTFTFTGSDSIYGYFVTDGSTTTVLWAEAFTAVENIPTGGGSIQLTLNVTLN